MPIKPENKNRYPDNWKYLVECIRERSRDACEGSPAYPDCRAKNHEPHPVTGSLVVLTVGHLDHTPENCDPKNLRHWCQRCHLTYDAKQHAQSAYATRREGKAIDWIKEPTLNVRFEGLTRPQVTELLKLTKPLGHGRIVERSKSNDGDTK